ncbi:MAG: [acyl-carrier-protein] S-malonyltransferase [Flavobacteriaceae bacterium]|nr:[acyl-carrier-protein] S-malonyltransferase [Flavobacteriaceae bacterium]|tara:strand:+ start:1343 stop:2224 length:882 start_codon:yes stop_codon:yes gene_type:complete
MKAYIFPGQGSQFPGMGKDLYDRYGLAKKLFLTADKILGFDISEIIFNGSKDDLKETKITQPAIYIHSVVLSKIMGDKFNPKFVAGHSLGELSALTAIGTISYEDGLKLVSKRAFAMQNACENVPGTMAAILGLEDKIVEQVCEEINGKVVTANYNCPGQIVISGEIKAVEIACEKLKLLNAKRTLMLPVGGAFHSPLMESAKNEFKNEIELIKFNNPICPIYQNFTASPVFNPFDIKKNLIEQITSPVKWTHTIKNMSLDGANEFIELGPGKVLQGLVKKILPDKESYSFEI